VSVFLERFILPVLAAIVVIVAITNPIGLEPMQRIVGTAALLLLAGIAAYTVHRQTHRRSQLGQTQRPQSQRPQSTPERNYVDFEPGYLLSFFASHTAIQSKQMVAGYVGSWMRLSGRLGNVMQNGEARWQLTFSPHVDVFMYFNGERWRPRLTTLRLGDKIIVDGRIRDVDTLSVHLEDCEFVDLIA
jgi:hypothetical protein